MGNQSQNKGTNKSVIEVYNSKYVDYDNFLRQGISEIKRICCIYGSTNTFFNEKENQAMFLCHKK